MAMTLSYLDDLSRVRVELTGITPDGFVIVERSANNGPPWQIVRGATNLPVTGGTAQVDDYEFFDSVPNWYRVRRGTDMTGLLLPNIAGSYASTPDDPLLDITADLDLRVDLTLDDWLSGDFRYVLAKYLTTGDQRSYAITISETGRIGLRWSPDGTLAETRVRTSDALTIPASGRLAIRAALDVDDGAGNHVVRFFTADTINGPWVQLGDANITSGVTSIFSGTADLTVGGRDNGTQNLFPGTIHSVEVRDGVSGVVVADPNFAVQPSGTTNFVDNAGRTWTIHGDALIVGEEVEPPQQITPSLNGVTWLKSIKYPALNRPIAEPDYRPVQRSSRTGVYNIKSRNPPIAVHDAWTSRYWTIETATESLEQARDMDLVIAAGGTLFVHVPLETENECFTNPVSGMPGGYVYILNSTQTHAVPGSHAFRWVLPVRIVATPAPEIYGTTLTWVTVERLYGSWTALWASNPTWRDLWDQIMDPEDAVPL